MTSSSLTQKRLGAGESLQFWARRGSCIYMASGKAYLMESPLWVAETMLREPYLLLGGSCHTVAESGWVVVHATSVSSIAITSAPALPAPLRQATASATRWLAVQLVRGGRLLGQWASAQQRAST